MHASREKGPWFIWAQVRRWFLVSSGSPDGAPQPWQHPMLGYAAALVVPFFTGLILWLLMQWAPGVQCPALLLLLAIVGIAVCWGNGPGLLATVLGICLLAGPFASSLGSVGGKPVAPLSDLGVFAGIGVSISLLVSRSRHASQQAEALTRELEAIFEAMADGVVVYDRTGQTRRMNAAWRTLMGIAAQSDLASHPFRERLARYDARDEHGIPVPPEQWPVYRLLQGEVLSGSHTMDLLLQTVDGRQIQVNFSGAPIRDTQGQVIGAVTISRDVTERRQLEREATTRARELEAIFEAIADGIIVYDLQRTIVQMNAATRSLLGFTLHPEVPARPAAQRLERYLPRTADGQPMPPEQWPLQRLLNGEVLTGANTVDMQIQTADGRSVLLNISGAPVRDESGHLSRLVTIIRDVTEHRRLQREAVERASELQAIFEAMADAVIVCDRQGAPVHMNSAYRRLLDEASLPQDPVPLPFEQALPVVPRDEQGHLLAAAQWPLSRLLQGETLTGTQTTDLHIRSRTGRHLHLNASGAPVYDARGQLSRVVLLLRDVSARHRMEEQTRKSLRALLAVAEALVDDPREGTMQEDPLSAMTRTLAGRIGLLTRSVLDCSYVGLLAWDSRTDVLRPLAVIGLSPRQERLFCQTVAGRHLHDLLGDPSLVGRLRSGETLSLDLTLPPWQWMSHLSEVHAAWLVPMRLRGQMVGVLCLAYREAAVVPSTQAFALAEAIANLVALVLERERLLQERAAAQAHMRMLARTDAITGLLNHRALLAQLSEELEQAHRKQLSCSVLVIDLDYFKAINDGYGHVVGDAVLVAFAQLVQAHLPAGATVGRWGGEEFVVLLPGWTSRAALRTAERVRSAVANQRFAVAEGLHLTCSIGVASFPNHAQDRDTLIRWADRAMYAAKSLGRNQARLADDVLVQALEDDVWRGPHKGRGTEMVDVLVSVVAAREQTAAQHADRVGDVLLQGAHALGIPTWQAHRIALAGRLHDVGKLAIPDGVLQKPGPLSRQEWTMIQTHPVLGAAIIGYIPALQDLAPLIRSHHERWDGTGYPDGLVGETIPLGARLLSVVDAYMAMTEDRCYQRACVPAEALAKLRLQAGKQFDPQMVEILEQVLREREVSHEKDPLS